jgi:uncharacterized RDD family membrane protein YckC
MNDKWIKRVEKFLQRKQIFVKPAPQDPKGYFYPKITDRMFAVNIDFVLIILFLMPINNLGYLKSNISVFFLLSFYFIFTTKKFGGTPGKRFMGMKVIDSITGNRISYMQSIIRFICYGVSALPLFAGFISGGFNKQRRTFHDKLADTIVIMDENRWYKKYFDRLKKYFNL